MHPLRCTRWQLRHWAHDEYTPLADTSTTPSTTGDAQKAQKHKRRSMNCCVTCGGCASTYIPEGARARVLVLGGGDGGATRELCKYDHNSVAEICVVDIDAVVVETCKMFPPGVSRAMHQDPRVSLHIEDAVKFLVDMPMEPKFDVVIIVLTDFGASDSIFNDFITRDNIARVLSPRGIVVRNFASVGFTYGQRDHLRELRSKDLFGSHFKHAYLYQCFQPTFMGGQYAFAFMSDTHDPLKTPWPAAKAPVLEGRTKYYTPAIHSGSFALPAHMVNPHPVR